MLLLQPPQSDGVKQTPAATPREDCTSTAIKYNTWFLIQYLVLNTVPGFLAKPGSMIRGPWFHDKGDTGSMIRGTLVP
jgi:hypothetical protein